MKKWFDNFLRKRLWKRQSGWWSKDSFTLDDNQDISYLGVIDCKDLTILQFYEFEKGRLK